MLDRLQKRITILSPSQHLVSNVHYISKLFYKMCLFLGQTYVQLCKDHTNLNLVHKAIEYLSICINKSASNDVIGYAYFYRGYGYRKVKQINESIADFKKVDCIDFNNEFGWNSKGGKQLKSLSKSQLFDIKIYQQGGKSWDTTINKIYHTEPCVLL